MRIYVLVTSYNPLTVYLYKSGFARFSRQRYSGTKDIDNMGNHFSLIIHYKYSNALDKCGNSKTSKGI